MSRHERRIRAARTESAFRDVNEDIVERTLVDDQTGDRMQILCECAHEQCAENLTVDHDVYAQVRERGALFLVAAGHVVDDVENVHERHGEIWVVRKVGIAGVVAEQHHDDDGPTS